MSNELYKILEVEPTASASDIKKAYRRLVNIYHPDKNKTKGAEDKFKEIANAYETLGSDDKRKTYDEQNKPKEKPRDPFDWSTMFQNSPFGQTGTGKSYWEQTKTKGADQNKFLYLTLEEVYKGCTKEIQLSTGKVKINISPGMGEGTKLKLAGKGDPSDNGGPRGDAIIIVKELAHLKFIKEGNDLHYTLELGFCDMMLGCDVLIPYIDGEMRLSVPKLMEEGKFLKLPNKGFKIKDKDAHGDMIVNLKIYYPKTLSTNERRLLEELSKCANMRSLSVKSKNRN